MFAAVRHVQAAPHEFDAGSVGLPLWQRTEPADGLKKIAHGEHLQDIFHLLDMFRGQNRQAFVFCSQGVQRNQRLREEDQLIFDVIALILSKGLRQHVDLRRVQPGIKMPEGILQRQLADQRIDPFGSDFGQCDGGESSIERIGDIPPRIGQSTIEVKDKELETWIR